MEKHDEFCWYCHKNKTESNCAKCVRTFHSECIAANGEQANVNEDEWTCPICTELKISERNQSREHLKMLPLIVEHVWNEKRFHKLWNSLNTMYLNADIDIVNRMDLYKIKENAATYTSFHELITDVKWMSHNVSILGSENEKHIKAFEKLIKFLKYETEYMEKCPECYSNWQRHANWFCIVCRNPHCIVWVKKDNCGYWPSKLISVNNDDDKVNVRFFGDYSQADVAVNNCYLYSKESPDQPAGERSQQQCLTTEYKSALSDPKYKAALKEVDLYIANICEKFGSFHFAERNTLFNPALVEQYTLQMIPGVANSNSKKRACPKTTPSSSVVKCSYEPAVKRTRSTDEADDFQDRKTQSDADESGIDLSEASLTDAALTHNSQPKSSTPNGYQLNTPTCADSILFNHGLEEIEDEFDNMVKMAKQGYRSQVVALTKELSALKDSHAKSVAAHTETQQAFAKALIENMAVRDDFMTLQTVVGDKDKIILDLKMEISAEKLRTSELQRMEQEYRCKMDKIERIIQGGGSSLESQHT